MTTEESNAVNDAGAETWSQLLEWLARKGFDHSSLKVELEASPRAGGVHYQRLVRVYRVAEVCARLQVDGDW